MHNFIPSYMDEPRFYKMFLKVSLENITSLIKLMLFLLNFAVLNITKHRNEMRSFQSIPGVG